MNFSLRVKLLGIAGLLLILMTVTGVIAIRNLSDVGKKGGSIYADRVVPLRDLGEARALLGDIDSQILRSFGTTADDAKLRATADTTATTSTRWSRPTSRPSSSTPRRPV